MEHRNIVVIGASAGGLEAIRLLLRAMPQDLDAAILNRAAHRDAGGKSAARDLRASVQSARFSS
jgi:two-component system chemotaxis response regulator CheB